MSDTTTTAQAAKTVAVEVGKIAAKSAAYTAVEVVGGIAIVVAAGFVLNAIQERKAKKLHVVKES